MERNVRCASPGIVWELTAGLGTRRTLERDALVDERDRFARERDAALEQADRIARERNAALGERDRIVHQRGTALDNASPMFYLPLPALSLERPPASASTQPFGRC
jgi:hypothetical protein